MGNLIFKRLKRDEQEAETVFFVLAIVIIFLLADIIYINTSVIRNSTNQTNQSQTMPLQNSQTTTNIKTPCVNCAINTPVSTAVPIQKSTSSNTTSPRVKEYFIPLGSGTNSSSDWQDITGAQALVNFNNYQNIKEVRFEASVTVPNASQIVWIRLYNKTDQHPVWYSDLSSNGNSQSYLVSNPIVYDSGDKTYQVQMKTQLSAPTTLDQARIHIILQ